MRCLIDAMNIQIKTLITEAHIHTSYFFACKLIKHTQIIILSNDIWICHIKTHTKFCKPNQTRHKL